MTSFTQYDMTCQREHDMSKRTCHQSHTKLSDNKPINMTLKHMTFDLTYIIMRHT
uniref:Uncharacterized protein n=1 Tax=Arion vulgaris TaxID=1028688 RepID=A0A0B7APW1_9EUPU